MSLRTSRVQLYAMLCYSSPTHTAHGDAMPLGVGCEVQAAISAGRPIQWHMDIASAPTGLRKQEALVAIVTRCLASEPTARPTASQLVELLTGVATSEDSRVVGSPGPSVLPSEQPRAAVPVTELPMAVTVTPTPATEKQYDVMGIIDTMERLNFDADKVGAVADAIGHLDSVSLPTLRSLVGVDRLPGSDLIRLRRLLEPTGSSLK